MAFQKLGGGTWTKWPDQKKTQSGEILTGRIKSLQVGKFGPMCIVENESGEYLLSGKSAYHALCQFDESGAVVGWLVQTGEILKVTFIGLKPTDKGNPMKEMNVEVDR